MRVSLQRTALLAITQLTVGAGAPRRKCNDRTDSVLFSDWFAQASRGRMTHAEIPAVLSGRARVGNSRGSMDATYRARARAREPSVQRDRAGTAGNLAVASVVTPSGPGRLRRCRAAAQGALHDSGIS